MKKINLVIILLLINSCTTKEYDLKILSTSKCLQDQLNPEICSCISNGIINIKNNHEEKVDLGKFLSNQKSSENSRDLYEGISMMCQRNFKLIQRNKK